VKLLLAALALAALPAPGEPGLTRGGLVTLYTQFQQDPPPAVLAAIQGELAQIMSPIGLSFEWAPLAASRGRVSADLAVVDFRGRCDASSLAPPESGSSVLGWTQVSDGVVLPFSDVDCDGIRAFVRFRLLRMDKANRDGAYGRAIARVLAHELYHVFANTRQHASHGVGRASYTTEELLSPVFRFEERAWPALRVAAHP